MARTTDKKMEMNRAAIYARVSDKSQDGEDKTSISEQIGEMEAYCEQKGMTITARYQEVGRGWSKKRAEFSGNVKGGSNGENHRQEDGNEPGGHLRPRLGQEPGRGRTRPPSPSR